MRRIKKAKVKFISLVPKGANKMPVIYKSDDTVEIQTLVKADDNFSENGELLAVVYAPDLIDSQGDFATSAVVKDMCYDAAKRGEQIDVRHNGQALSRDQAYVAERFLIQKGDERFSDWKDYEGNPVDLTGAWATVLKIEDAYLRKLYREGEWGGVSIGGEAVFDEVKADDMKAVVKSVFSELFNKSPKTSTKDGDMTPEELKKILEEREKALLASITKSIKGTSDPEPASADDSRPVFKGDPTDAKEVAKHAEALRRYELGQRLSKATTAAEVEEVMAEIAKAKKTSDDGDGDGEAARLRKEIEEKEAEIARLEKASTVPPAEGSESKSNILSMFSKEDRKAFEAGVKMADYSNKARGLA